MKASSIYRNIAKTAALAAISAIALVAATAAQARPHHFQDVQYVQAGAKLVISPPQLVLQAPLPHVYATAQPVYAQPVQSHHVYPRHVYTRPVVTAPVYVPPQPIYYRTNFIPGQIYYVDGRPFLNGHPYYGKGHKRHHGKHFDKHHGGYR